MFNSEKNAFTLHLSQAAGTPAAVLFVIPSRGKFITEIRTATLGSRVITVEHLTPILSPQERETRRREIENILYDVFVKYVDTGGNKA